MPHGGAKFLARFLVSNPLLAIAPLKPEGGVVGQYIDRCISVPSLALPDRFFFFYLGTGNPSPSKRKKAVWQRETKACLVIYRPVYNPMYQLAMVSIRLK